MKENKEQNLPQHEIGGYLDLSANRPEKNTFDLCYAFNAARYCLQYIIQERRYTKIWLPSYGCHSMADAVTRAGAIVRYYELDTDFTPLLGKRSVTDPLLYINYYGMMTHKCEDVAKAYPTVIIDNAQAFYAPQIRNCDCLYSPRKFFALPDGGILVPGQALPLPVLPKAMGYDKMEHILRRVDCGAPGAYQASLSSREQIAAAGMQGMSLLARLMLAQADVSCVARKRRENWEELHASLKQYNALYLPLSISDVPLFYPFAFRSDTLRKALNDAKIYTPTYWPSVKTIAGRHSFDMYLYTYLHPLPIDQRYGIEDMRFISSTITNFIRVNNNVAETVQ